MVIQKSPYSYILAAAVLLASHRAAADTAAWLNPVSGNWIDGSKWSTNPVFPNSPTVDAVIAVPSSSFFVTLQNSSSIQTNSVTLNSPVVLDLEGSLQTNLLQINAGSVTAGGSQANLINARIQGAGTYFAGNLSTLTNVTLAGTATASRFGNLQTALTFDGGTLSIGIHTAAFGADVGTLSANFSSFTGTGAILFDGGTGENVSSLSAGNLLFGSGMVLSTNLGDASITGSQVFNQGTFNVNAAATFSVNGVLTNTGTINLNQGTLFIGATSAAGMGTLNRTGGTVILSALTADASGTVDIDSAFHGPVRLTGTTDVSQFAVSAGSTFYIAPPPGTNALFTAAAGVTFLGDTQILASNGGTVTFAGGLTLAGRTLSIGDATNLKVLGGQLAGTGQLAFTSFYTSSVSTVDGPSGGTLVIGPGLTLRNLSGILAVGNSGSIINQGIITAEAPDGFVRIQGTNWKNQGTLVRAGGNLSLRGTFRTADVGVIVGTGPQLAFEYATVDNSAYNFSLGSPANAWTALSSSFHGGTLSTAGASLRVVNYLGLTLDGVTLAGNFSDSDFGFSKIVNGLTLDATATQVGAFYTRFSGSQLLGGTGTLTLSAIANATTLEAADGTLTIGPNITIRTGTSYIRFASVISQSYPLINQGVLASQVANRVLTLAGEPFVNQGTITASNGGAVSLSNLANAGSVIGSTSIFNLSGTLANTGTLSFDTSTVTLTAATDWSNQGAIVFSGSTATVTGPLSNRALFTTVNGGSLSLSTLTNAADGTVTVDNSALTLTGISANAGRIDARNGAALRLNGTLTNSGLISIADGALFQVGSLDNTGTLSITNAFFLTSTLALPGGTLLLNNATVAFTGALSALDSPFDMADLPGNAFGYGASAASLTLTNSEPQASVVSVPNYLVPTLFDNVTLAADLRVQTAATLAVSHTLTLANATIFGDLNPAASAAVLFFNPGSALAGSGTLASTLVATFSSGAFTLAGTISSSGTVQVVSASVAQTQEFSNNRNFLIDSGTLTQSPRARFTNPGTLSLACQGLFLQNGTLSNSGVISVSTGATLASADSFANAGTLSLDGGVLTVNSLAPLGGTFLRNTGTVALTGVLYAVDTDLAAVPYFGPADLGSAASISSLTLSNSAGPINVFRTANSTAATSFSAVTLGSDLTVHKAATLAVSASLTLSDHTVHIGDAAGGATLLFNAGASLVGAGTLVFDGPFLATSTLTLGGSFTLPLSAALRTGTASGIIPTAGVTLTNLGTISAEPQASLRIVSTLINSGLLQAINGSSLLVNNFSANSSIIRAGASSSIYLIAVGSALNTGEISADGGVLNLSGATFTLGGTVEALNGGALNFNTATAYTVAAPLFLSSNSSATFDSPTVSLATITGNGNVSLRANRTATSDGLSANSLALGANSSWTIRNGNPLNGLSKLNTLSLAHTNTGTAAAYSSLLQLNNNRLVLQFTDPTDKADKILALNTAIFSGKNKGNAGLWSGPGITGSAVAADSQRLTIGVFDNGLLHKTSFAGGTDNVDEHSLLLSPALLGDANLDGIVNFNDMLVVTGNWNATGQINGISTIDFAHGDLNADGVVNFNDMLVVTGHWNNSSSAFDLSSQISQALQDPGVNPGTLPPPTSIPEPASLTLLLLALPLLVRRSPTPTSPPP